MLAVPVVVVGYLVAHLVGVMRVATLDELKAALVGEGADTERAARIAQALANAGLRDVGSIRALYDDAGWRPRLALHMRGRVRERRRAEVGLASSDQRELRAALDSFPADAAVSLANWWEAAAGGRLQVLGRALAIFAAPVEAAGQRVVQQRQLVVERRGEVVDLVRSGVPWLLGRSSGQVRGAAHRDRMARELDLPRTLVDAIAADSGIPADEPRAVRGQLGRDRDFESDLLRVAGALRQQRQDWARAEDRLNEAITTWHAEQRAHRTAVAAAVQAAVEVGMPVAAIARVARLPMCEVRAVAGGAESAGPADGGDRSRRPTVRPGGVPSDLDPRRVDRPQKRGRRGH